MYSGGSQPPPLFPHCVHFMENPEAGCRNLVPTLGSSCGADGRGNLPCAKLWMWPLQVSEPLLCRKSQLCLVLLNEACVLHVGNNTHMRLMWST